MAARVLIAAAEELGGLAEVLRAAGHTVESCAPARLGAALEAAAADACVIALAGERLPRELSALLELTDRPALVALVEDAAGALAAEALERGVDALAPRTASSGWIAASVRSALAQRALHGELTRRRADQRELDELVLLGGSQAARRLREALERVASTPRTTVLISGERNAGLEQAARLVHARSARAAGPLAELRAGVEDDAEQARDLLRLVAQAQAGTLIVHEVGSAGPALQKALASALERAGPESAAPDVRCVATTSSDLAREVEAGRFGEDLLYKLNVLSLALPPFSARRTDLAEIAKRALERAKRLGLRAPALDREALSSIALRPWTGGLGELIAAVESGSLRATPAASDAAISAPGWIALEGAPALPSAGAVPSPARSLRSAEESLIRQVMAETGGNKLRSAEILGIHRTTLYSKLREYGIEA